jgi:hypothetical protein
MSECPHGKRFAPLPLRRGFWRELPKKIKEGVVLLAEDLPESEDIRNAAQSILIGYIESRLMESFRRPTLKPGGDFFQEFFATYMEAIQIEELRVWEEMSCEIDYAISERPDRDLTDKEAAYLTYTMLGYEIPPQSQELYMNLAVYARVYDELLRGKYGEHYTPTFFYKALREHMPAFLFKLIGMSSVISALLTMNAKPRELVDETLILQPHTILESRFMEIGEDNSFFFLPKFVEVVYEHVEEKNFTNDFVGRTEDRGCPVLYASGRNTIIHFSIEELIAQHKLYEHNT